MPSAIAGSRGDLVSTLIREGAAQIREHGWTAGTYNQYGSGKMCIVGGVLAAGVLRDHFGLSEDINVACLRLEAQMHADYPQYIDRDIISWNDTYGNQETVLAIMDRAAELKYMEGT